MLRTRRACRCPGSILTEGTKELFYGTTKELGTAYDHTGTTDATKAQGSKLQGSAADRMLSHVYAPFEAVLQPFHH